MVRGHFSGEIWLVIAKKAKRRTGQYRKDLAMIYCISDIHGDLDKFHAMLERIHFSKEDVLYIIGDVIDRLSGGINLLKEIMIAPNMVMLLGNHEEMCLNTLGPKNTYGSRELWRQNGGDCTYQELVHICSLPERQKIIEFLGALPDHLEIQVGRQSFYLVHGIPSERRDERIWGRPVLSAPPPFPNRTAIVGHTPTCFLAGKQSGPYSIWHGNEIIDIDCGCGSEDKNSRLACLRLDDLKEFYV